MNNDTLIEIDNVSKRYCRDLKRSLWYGVKDLSTDLFNASKAEGVLRKNEFWANKDITFDVKRGECLGLIGHNGAGKTTLLKLLCGLIKLDSGTITLKGNVGALIALGAGFNPILTGRENIYVNGAILGFTSAEITKKLDEIVAFAEIPEAIDAPVQTYSSGMQVRLGFAIAAILSDPDILLLDEVLAVGDSKFQIKCINHVSKMLRKDKAAVFVSHSMSNIQHICTKTALFEKGRLVKMGNTGEVIQNYIALSNSGEIENPSEVIKCSDKIDFLEASISKSQDENGLDITVVYQSYTEDILKVVPHIALYGGEMLFYENRFDGTVVEIKGRTKGTLTFKFEEFPSNQNKLRSGLLIRDINTSEILAHMRGIEFDYECNSNNQGALALPVEIVNTPIS